MVANGSSCFSLRTSIAPEIWWRVAGHDNVDDTFSREPFGHRSGSADLFLVATDLGGSDAPGQCNLEPKWTLEKRDKGGILVKIKTTSSRHCTKSVFEV